MTLTDLNVPTPQPVSVLAGRTALHIAAWEKVTSDPCVLEAIKGYRMEFTAHPQQSHSPTTVESGECAKAISE